MPVLESVIVHDNKTGAAIPGALVVLWDQGGRSDARTTDGSGFCNFGHWESAGITLSVQAAGFAQVNDYKTDDTTPLIVKMEPSTLPFFDVQESGFIHSARPAGGAWPQPAWWYREDGKPWFMAGINSHLLMTRVAKGEDVTWFFDYMDSVGANTCQIICVHLSQWKQDNGYFFDPLQVDYTGILSRTCDLFAARKKRVLFNVLADCQGKSVQYKQQVWDQTINVVKGRAECILGKGNEDGVNGWHIDDLRNPSQAEMAGVPVSQGNNGGGTSPPHQPFLDFVQWEARPDPRKKNFDDSGAGAWEMYEGYGLTNTKNFPPVGVPVVVGESAIANDTNPDQWGDFRWTDPADYLLMGLNTGANFAGGFVSSSNLLEAKPNGPIADQCVRQYFRGFWRAAVR